VLEYRSEVVVTLGLWMAISFIRSQIFIDTGPAIFGRCGTMSEIFLWMTPVCVEYTFTSISAKNKVE